MGSTVKLQQAGWFISDQALQDLREELEEGSNLESALLDEDLKKVGHGSLPDDVNRMQSGAVKGPSILQVVSIMDATRPTLADLSAIRDSRRLLTLKLTDGKTTVKAVEYRKVEELSEDIPPGTKVRIQDVPVKVGVMLLEPRNIKVLGGRVEDLAAAWETQRKYGGPGRAMGEGVGEDGALAPPFKHFVAGRDSRPPRRALGPPGPAQDQAGPRGVPPPPGRGSSDQGALVSSTSGAAAAAAAAAVLPSGRMDSRALSTSQVAQVSSSQPPPANSNSRMVATDHGNDRQPIPAPAPIVGNWTGGSSNVAREKLKSTLEAREDGGRGGYGSRGSSARRGRGRRGRRDDDDDGGQGSMTLEEWEAQQAARKAALAGVIAAPAAAPKAPAPAAPTQSQIEADEALARALQEQLDMEESSGYARGAGSSGRPYSGRAPGSQAASGRDQGSGARQGGQPSKSNAGVELAASLFSYGNNNDDRYAGYERREGGRGHKGSYRRRY